MNFLKRITAPPVFDDEAKTQQAYLLHIIGWTLICAPLPFVAYSFSLPNEILHRSLILIGVGETINILLLVILQRGHVKAVSVMQAGAFWMLFTAIAVTGRGVRGEAYLIGYVIVITIAGILLGGRGALVFTVLSLAAGAGMVAWEWRGGLRPIGENTPLTTWIVSLVLFPVGAVLQHLGSRAMRYALARARSSEERYRLISQVSSDYTFSTALDPEGKTYLNWVAGAFEQMTGYTFDEYVATGGWQGHLHPEDAQRDEAAFEKLSRNESAITEVRTFKKNREIAWVRVYAHPVWDDGNKRLAGIVGAVQDITEQKQAEEALTQERDLLQIFLDNIPDIIHLKDVHSRILRINRAQADSWNLFHPSEAVGKSDFDFHPPEMARRFQEEERQILAGGEPIINRLDYRPTENGEPRWFSVSKLPVQDSDGHVVGIMSISRDVTRQKLSEERKAKRREYLEKTLELGKQVTGTTNLSDTLKKIWHGVHDVLDFDRMAVFLYNPERHSMDSMIGTSVNGEMEDTSGIWFPIAEQTTFKTVLDKPDGLFLTHQYDEENNIPKGHEMYGVKDFAAVAAWAGEKPVAVICVDQLLSQRRITDVQLEALRLFAGYAGLAIENSRLNEALKHELEQQKRAEENESSRRAMLEKVILLGQQVTQVKEMRVTLEQIWHGVHDVIGFDRLAIFLYDEETNTIHGTLGTDNDGHMVEEWDYRRSLHHEKPTSFMRALEQPDGLFYTDNFAVEFDIPEGHEMHSVRDFAAVSAWAGDKPVAIITVDNLPSSRPFTSPQLEALRLFAGYAGLAIENSRLDAALQAELEQRRALIVELENKNAELERFTYTVSHDLKSPLVTITGFLGFLEDDITNGRTERVTGNIRKISAATRKMQTLLNDLLELSRIGRIINQPENIPFGEIVNEAVDRVRGVLDEHDVILEIQRDLPAVYGDRIRLVEVVQNLLENAVKYSKSNVRPRIEIGMSGPDEHGFPVFHVRDNGIGIEAQYHEHIFGLFNKLDMHTPGSGVGLSLVKRIIEVHNGRIWVESEKGKGAAFHFSLPTPQSKE
jgi:PAS domain S-box-containing protein